jgi:hypothetical protein
MILASKLRSFIAGSTSQVIHKFYHQTYLVFTAKVERLFPPNLCEFLSKKKSVPGVPADIFVWHFSATVN